MNGHIEVQGSAGYATGGLRQPKAECLCVAGYCETRYRRMIIAGAKVWPLFIALGAAATAAGVSVWASYASRGFVLAPSGAATACYAEDGESLSSVQDGTAAVHAQNVTAEAGSRVPPQAFLQESCSNALPPCTAVCYALALQEGRADDVISMTYWMQERLKRVRMGSDEPDDLAAAREQLREDILSRTLEGNRLRPEGVEDKYVFAPGARIELLGSDKREDARGDPLACPVKERTWLRVEYPIATAALRDEAGRPIRSIVVGVDISPDGYVLKAGILGNVELDRNGISLDWGK